MSRSPAWRRLAITNPVPSLAWRPSPSATNARMLVAIVTTDKVSYFLKMVGPDKTMTALKPTFEALIASLEVKED